MHNWDELDESGHCTSESDFTAVQEICSHLEIPCRRVSFVKEYWNKVFRYVCACVWLLHHLMDDCAAQRYIAITFVRWA